MPDQFVHIHNHTEYSLLDGANRIPELVKRAKEFNQPALAITDHGVMFGVMEFYFECLKQGIKPLIGMEAYVAPNGLHKKSGREENESYHLLLIAKNAEGYKNLCKLHTVAALQGFYYRPRIDHELLRQHSKGLISTTTCLGSEINQLLLKGDYEEAQRRAGMYKEIFDEGSFFVELQDHGLAEQHQVKEGLLRIAKELKLPLIATNDAHYLCRESSRAHDVLLCIGTGALVSDEKRLRFETDEFYLKSTDEMATLFSDTPDAIENSLQIADLCDLELGKQRAPMPVPELPQGMDSKAFLRQLSENGLKERCSDLGEREWERLEYELSVIDKTGFEDYFLLVREFAQFTRNQDIAFGVRGSAAGSLVSYCIGITDVNPVEYDLTFERFLNPERISMPDIDMDFEDARRDEVIRYVVDRFGQEQTAQIITFGTLGAKAAIKDSGRVMGYSPADTDRICKTIPNIPGMSLDRALKESNEFRQIIEHEPSAKKLFDVAKEVEGTSRHAGVHAAGVVISKGPLTDYIPLYRGNDGQAVTAFEMGILEKIGLLKMDFLGLSNLTVLSRAVQNIAATNKLEKPLDWRDFPLDDDKTYDMLERGETVGVFQLESGGMRRNIIELKPRDVRELAAMVALYRPGPIEHIPLFVDCKFGRKPIKYLDARMEPILSETYGVIVYQDQVLKLVQALAGFSLGKADVLRRAMGKKDKAQMDAMLVDYMAGCEANGVATDSAKKVWELLLPFAGYAFNKAHAVCYALIAYQTAYLKANYPVEYLAALLAVYQDNEDKVINFIEEARRSKIQILRPDVNRSEIEFSIETVRATKKSVETLRAIRFGLVAIRGVGEGLSQAIIDERQKKPFTHLYEFCERVRPAGLNRTALEALIKAGALDSISPNRNQLLEYSDAGLCYADQALKSRLAGQNSLFGGGEAGDAAESELPNLPEMPALSRVEILRFEKDVMGIYVSDHPLRGMERTLREAATHSCASVAELEDNTQVMLAGIISGVQIRITKAKGEKMATIVLEDFSGQANGTVFAATYAKIGHLVQKDSVVKIRGTVSHRERPGGDKTIEVRVDDVQLMPPPLDIPEDYIDDTIDGTLTISIPRATRAQLENLKQVLADAPGTFRCLIELSDESPLVIETRQRIRAEDDVIQAIRAALPGCDVQKLLKADLTPVEDGDSAVA